MGYYFERQKLSGSLASEPLGYRPSSALSALLWSLVTIGSSDHFLSRMRVGRFSVGIKNQLLSHLKLGLSPNT